MKATIRSTGATIEAATLKAIRSTLNSMLRIGGPRGLTADTDTGAVIHVELYDSQDYIMAADGRTIYHS